MGMRRCTKIFVVYEWLLKAMMIYSSSWSCRSRPSMVLKILFGAALLLPPQTPNKEWTICEKRGFHPQKHQCHNSAALIHHWIIFFARSPLHESFGDLPELIPALLALRAPLQPSFLCLKLVHSLLEVPNLTKSAGQVALPRQWQAEAQLPWMDWKKNSHESILKKLLFV